MLISFNWLKQYVDLPDSVTPEEVAEKLKLSTVEVEKVERQGSQLDNVVVGKVLKCEQHPNADKLKVCTVDIGNEKLTVVCGGSNVREGLLIALAKVGAKVKWHGEGELVELKPVTIRGVESHGMICASDEIGLAEMFPKKEAKEILDLSGLAGVPAGSPLAAVLELNDTVLEIDNKSLSNRPDLWGHYGLAREVAALFNRAVSPYQTKPFAPGKELKLKVTVADTKLCPRYTLVAMSGITVEPSPAWLQARLKAVSVRPINNIVDITNYIMFDLGQPMHAFDVAKLANDKKSAAINLYVRPARANETITTLDGKQHQLEPPMVVIATENSVDDLGGIMGGLGSSITETASVILLEAANFDAATVRRTAGQLGIRTEASSRFEKSLDPNLPELALKRAVALVRELCPGARVASNIVDEKDFRLFTGPLEISFDFFAKKLGVEIPEKTIVAILERLGFVVTKKKDILFVKIPTWRATRDISIPEDIVEEVARIWGYDNIPSVLPAFPVNPPESNKLRVLERIVGETLVRELGYAEVYNYSFVSESQILQLGDTVERHLELDNPLSKEKPYLRYRLLNNLIENLSNNISDRQSLKLFEIGAVYHADEAGPRVMASSDELLPRQDAWLTSVTVDKSDRTPFWAARRVAEAIGRELKIDWAIRPAQTERPWRHPARSAQLLLGDVKCGFVYELHPAAAERCGLAERVGVCALNLSRLVELLSTLNFSQQYKPISPYPSVTRDLALAVKTANTHAEILSALKKADPLLTNVELFDVYTGSNLTAGCKSMAYHLTFAHPERTLTSEEVDKTYAQVEQMLVKKFGAEVRK